MASRTYPHEPTIESFGTKLLLTGDLDPLYIALAGADLGEDLLKRFLFAYWCCYHAGASAFIADHSGSDYWDMMATMAENSHVGPTPLGGRWPRGHERRHFRGEKAEKAVERYAERFKRGGDEAVDWLRASSISAVNGRASFARLRTKVMELPQFGPWIAFKVGDMMERVLGVPIDFTDSDVFMFDSPREAALETARLWSENNEDFGEVSIKRGMALVKGVSTTLIEYFKNHTAPPRNDRPVNIQEVETILCKWKSHLTGSYPLGLDSEEIKHGLKEWAPFSVTAQRLLLVAPTHAII